MRSLLIQGPPGTGKTLLAAMTAPKKPRILIDIDGKARSMIALAPLINAKVPDLVVHELGVPLINQRLDYRARAISANEKTPIEPKGWVKFAEIIEDIFQGAEKKGVAPGGTLILDSRTQLCDHLKRYIMHHDPRGKATLNDRNWGTFLNMNVESVDNMKTACKRWDMDYIEIVHERISEKPTSRTTTYRVKSPDGGPSRREFEGEMQALIASSIDGQFGLIFASYFTEVYQTFVEVDEDRNPKWKIRILPDGLRDLRTSSITKDALHEPDLSKLWGPA